MTTPSEETYAGWLNLLGSGGEESPELHQELLIMRVVATSSGDSERFSETYMDILLALAPAVGARKAKRMTEALVAAARAHRVRYVPGTPLMIDGRDCSPDAVRALQADRDHYRDMAIENATRFGSVTA
jgi:hypothetical protein